MSTHPLLNRNPEDYDPQGHYDHKIAKKLSPWMELHYSAQERQDLTCDRLNEDSSKSFKVRAVKLTKSVNLVKLWQGKPTAFDDEWNAFCADYPFENLFMVCDYHGDGLSDIVVTNFSLFRDDAIPLNHISLKHTANLQTYDNDPLRIYFLKDVLEYGS